MSGPSCLLPLAALLLTTFGAGCLGREQRENEGTVCVSARPYPFDGSAGGLRAGQALFVHFAGRCMSSSCGRDFAAACQVERAGNEITVTSATSWTPRACGIPGVGGNPDCVGGSATCTLGTLEDGTYTLRHGAAQTTFTVPTTAPGEPCAGL